MINKAIKIFKQLGYLISIPVIAGLSVYFMGAQIDIQKEKNEILKNQVEFLTNTQEITSYSKVWSEIKSQRGIHEDKIEKINKKIISLRLKLEESINQSEKQKIIISELKVLLDEKYIILENIKNIVYKRKEKRKITKLKKIIKQANSKNYYLEKYNNELIKNDGDLKNVNKRLSSTSSILRINNKTLTSQIKSINEYNENLSMSIEKLDKEIEYYKSIKTNKNFKLRVANNMPLRDNKVVGIYGEVPKNHKGIIAFSNYGSVVLLEKNIRGRFGIKTLLNYREKYGFIILISYRENKYINYNKNYRSLFHLLKAISTKGRNKELSIKSRYVYFRR